MPDEVDGDLLRRFVRGDEAAFEALLPWALATRPAWPKSWQFLNLFAADEYAESATPCRLSRKIAGISRGMLLS